MALLQHRAGHSSSMPWLSPVVVPSMERWQDALLECNVSQQAAPSRCQSLHTGMACYDRCSGSDQAYRLESRAKPGAHLALKLVSIQSDPVSHGHVARHVHKVGRRVAQPHSVGQRGVLGQLQERWPDAHDLRAHTLQHMSLESGHSCSMPFMSVLQVPGWRSGYMRRCMSGLPIPA